MKYASEALGLFIVVPLVALGLWCFPELNQTTTRSLSSEAEGPARAGATLSCGNQVDWSSDDSRLFLRYRGGDDFETRLALLGPTDGTLRIPVDNLGDSIDAAALAPDGRHVLVGTQLGRLWWIDRLDEAEPELIIDLQGKCTLSSITLTRSGRRIALGTGDGRIYVAEVDDLLQTGFIPLTADPRQARIGQLKFSHDGERLLAARNDGGLELWDLSTRRRLQGFTGHSDVTKGAAFLPDDRRIISAGLDDTVRIWEIESGRETWRGDFGLLDIHTLDVSRDGRTAAWGGNSNKVIVWDLERGCRKLPIETPLSAVFHLSFSGDGTKLAVTGRGSHVHVYDTETAQEVASLRF